jgi:hypothetical protein
VKKDTEYCFDPSHGSVLAYRAKGTRSMTRAEENRVRILVHGFLHSDITAVEFQAELSQITGRNAYNKTRSAACHTVASPQDMRSAVA